MKITKVTPFLTCPGRNYVWVKVEKAADAGIFSSQEKERWIAQVKRDAQSWSGVRFPGSALLAKIFRKLAETFPVASYLGWADGDRHIGNVRNV
jgi:hypothetical protein